MCGGTDQLQPSCCSRGQGEWAVTDLVCVQVDLKMSLVAMPLYQRRHKHFDQSYRHVQTRYLLEEYAAKR